MSSDIKVNMNRVTRLMDAIRAVAELERALPRAITPELREILREHVAGAERVINAITQTFAPRLSALRVALDRKGV